ncbi:MAG: 4Fe-4S dicluster domain-containing protein [Desulfocapsaceae bacterium]|jgi:NAD-dependent dihydropyrimidine dehydrogenase PreA subunit|nr:4Fe-4S dicluster domain-containing protein [Desulfocapsaceae bacterium]
MKQIRKIIKIDEELCDGCGLCVPDCAEGSLQIIDGKAKLVADNLCDGLGACLGSCPTGALQIIERQADEFDEEAVEEFLAAQKQKQAAKATPQTMDCGCASTHIQSFKPQTPCQSANKPVELRPADKPVGLQNARSSDSQLSHWPIQIRLIPPGAPFLQGADILIAADCCAAAAPDFQNKYLAGKVVMMGCPKFDDAESYIERFAEIIDSCNLHSITILIMEVPCCSAMNVIVKKALEKASNTVPVEQITISTRGQELQRIIW